MLVFPSIIHLPRSRYLQNNTDILVNYTEYVSSLSSSTENEILKNFIPLFTNRQSFINFRNWQIPVSFIVFVSIDFVTICLWTTFFNNIFLIQTVIDNLCTYLVLWKS